MERSQGELEPYQITVCVPIYNTERWLSGCLDSLVSQDIWEKLFVILVDDGSEDGSFKIAQKFSQEHPKKTLLLSHGENKGTLAARYSAIMRIKTPFAMFVDSDDLLPPSACSSLYEAIVSKKADVVMGQMRVLDGVKIKNKPYIDQWFQYYCETDNLRLQGDFEIAGLTMCWKIYRSTIIKATVYGTIGRAFSAISMGEDVLLSTAIFMKAQKIFLTNKVVYYYRVNNKSITHNVRNKHIIECFLVSLNIWKLSIYYHCLKLAERGGSILNSTENAFFNSEICFPYDSKMLNIIASMNKIANELGENFQFSFILEQESKLMKEFGIPRLCEALEISEYRFYNFKKPEQPNLSIIIPVHNSCEFLDRCLESILLQTEPEIEIILVGCASLEGCRRLIQDYSRRDSRIVLVEHLKNKKHFNALSTAIEIAKAPWFMIVDSNDYIDHDAVRILIQKAHSFPQAGLIVCGAMGLAEDGRILKIANCPTEDMLIEDSFKYYHDHHLLYMPDKAGAKMWRRDIFNSDLELYSYNIKPSENSDWFMQIISNLRHPTLFVKDRIYYYGIRSDNVLIDSVEAMSQLKRTGNRTISNCKHYHFRRLEFRKKIWSIARTLSKKLKLYRTLRFFVNIIRYLHRNFVKIVKYFLN